MSSIKVIITGATGMVGEGVMLECLQNPAVEEVLIINRKHYDYQHPKLKELLVPNFMELEKYSENLEQYDACFYCAGVSSLGMSEADYTKITYDTTLHFAKVLAQKNPNMVFDYVTGSYTDSTEKGKLMWARVKGKTENDLMKLPFQGQYNFRPGFMKAFPEQKNVKTVFKVFGWFYPKLFPKISLTLAEVSRSIIHSVTLTYPKQVLEISDIKVLAK